LKFKPFLFYPVEMATGFKWVSEPVENLTKLSEPVEHFKWV
jgi:hypothetical protein